MTKIAQCEQCNAKISKEPCEFAVFKSVVSGREHVFCCRKCAEQYQKKKRG